MTCRIMGTGKEFVFIFVIIVIMQLLCWVGGSLASNCSVPDQWLPKSALCLHPGKYTVSVEKEICYHVCLDYNREALDWGRRNYKLQGILDWKNGWFQTHIKLPFHSAVEILEGIISQKSTLKKEIKIYLAQSKGSCQARKLGLGWIFSYFIWSTQLSHLGASEKQVNLLWKRTKNL